MKRPIKKIPRKPVAAKKPSTVKERYKQDKDFREIRKKESRTSYRKKLGKDFEIVSPLRSLDYYTTLAEQLPITYNGNTFTAPCIKVTTLADLLQTSYQSLWRSITAETIPAPVLVTHMGKRELLVYHQDEVRVILSIVGEHKKRFKYYRKDHTDTKTKLYDAISTIRNDWENLWPAKQPAPRPQPKPKSALPKPRKLKRK